MTERSTAPLTLDLVEHPATQRLLYHHQAIVLDEWDHHSTFVLETRTGTGKTSAAMLPLLKRRLSAVAVYPTNELLRDQARSIETLAEREGLSVCTWTPEDESGYAQADVVLVPIDAEILSRWCRKRGCSTKGRALQELLTRDHTFKLVLTNPDVLFLIFALRYRAEALAALQQYHALVVDEFHLYTGVELAHALMMADFGKRLGAFDKLLLLSATPDPETGAYLERLFHPRRVTLGDRAARRVCGARRAVEAVRLTALFEGRDIVETAFGEVTRRCQEIRERRGARPEPDYLPALVVVNSVVDAIRLEDRLVEEHLFERDELAVIRGLSSRRVRSLKGKHLAIGTAAVEVGIDFRCDLLIFQASDAASFLQRFGRVGRHEPGTAVILCPPNVAAGIEAIEGGIDRGAFEERVHAWYCQRPAYAWFAATRGGLVTTRALTESILLKMRDDLDADPKDVAANTEILIGHWQEYARSLGASEKDVESVRRQFDKMDRKPEYRWLRVYSELNTFRTSLPSEWVHDFAEEDRRGDRALADYQVDIATLLRRAEGLRFGETRWNHQVQPSRQGMLTVQGYGRWRLVEVLPTCEYVCDSHVMTTDVSPGDDLRFVQDGNRHLTPVSHLMSLRPHVYVLLPKTARDEVDWRIPLFPCGDRVIAFDGAALLATEIWARRKGHGGTGCSLRPAMPD